MILFMLLLSQYYFGQNKIQYNQFDWLMNETEHFEIYYYKSGEVLVPFAEDVLEESYNRLKRRFGYREKKNEEKIPVLIYKSHPDFEGTNVILERIPESVGGFTEIFKNRIVLPFDGSYSNFRHVLYHELVHVFQYRILFGGGIGALQRAATLNIPLWFIEGMAEFESMGWDESAESFIRDAVINDRLYPIQILNYAGGYVVYKEGQSIIHYIKERYGDEKIGELMNKTKVTGSLTGAIKTVLGIDEDKLSEDWIKSLKEEYWPLVGIKEDVNDLTTPIVTHKESRNIYNYAPAVSPSGDKIVYYTDRTEEVQIRVVSAINSEDLGLLIKGGRSPKFESLHLMDGHLDFSPDGQFIAFAALEKGKDVLYIYDLKERKIKDRLEFPLDRIRWPEWSFDGLKIAFMGLKNGASDIYVYNLKDKDLNNITHDRYSDGEPTWKGDSILFVSDRPDFNEWNYEKTKLYITDLKGNVREYLDFGEKILNPEVYNSNVYFISYRDGGKNLYVYKPDSGVVKQLTDLIGSLESFSTSPSGKFAFSVYSNVGWDILLSENVEELKGKEPNPPMEFTTENIDVSLNENSRRKKAPLKFGVDYLSTTLGYYSDYGLYGYLQLGMSDILGNHQLYALFNSTDLTSSDFYIQYLYLKHRLDYTLYVLRQRDYFLYGNNIMRGDIWSIGGEVWYPIDRFNRFEFGLSGYRLGGEIYDFDPFYGWVPVSSNISYGTFGSISFVRDNTIWGYTAPVKGFRGRITYERSLINGEDFWDVDNVWLDFRKYWYLSKNWNFCARLFLLHSWGEDNRNFSTVSLGGGRSIRGYPYDYIYGTTAGFLNLELRFPLIKKLEMGLPPISFAGIEGALFMDIGGATYNYKDFKFFKTDNSYLELVDPIMSFGLETRLNLGITMLNFDVSKRTNLNKISNQTYYDFYLGFPF